MDTPGIQSDVTVEGLVIMAAVLVLIPVVIGIATWIERRRPR